MRYSNRELWAAFIAILLTTLVYLLVIIYTGSIPAASEFFGHALGVAGFTLMIMTELLYSWRKRNRSARLGRLANWLQFHIFTGLYGPFLVLLHTSWKFNGLAGIVLLLTVIVVLSGVVGRYIYTAVPRTSDGIALEAEDLEGAIAEAERDLQAFLLAHSAAARDLAARMESLDAAPVTSYAGVLRRGFQEWRLRLAWWQQKRTASAASRAQTAQLEKLFDRRRLLRRQLESLAFARRLLGLWHAIHIPIGLALFSLATLHIGAAIYYATLLR